VSTARHTGKSYRHLDNALTRVNAQTGLLSCLEHIYEASLPRIGVAKMEWPLNPRILGLVSSMKIVVTNEDFVLRVV